MIPRVLVATNMYPNEADPARGAFVAAQVEALRGLGLPVEVFYLRGDRRATNYARAIRPLRLAVRAFQADLVYAFYGLTGWVALWQPMPIVLSLAGDDILGTPSRTGSLTMKSRIGVALSQWTARRAAVVCVQSEEMRARLWGAGLRRRALVIPYGVDPSRFHPDDQAKARRRLGLPPAERLVIFPNTPTEPRKRLDLAEAAMALVRPTVPDAVLRIVTGVPHGDMPDYYRAADCCLLTSDWEGSPNVVKEALFSGLPVVSTDVGDVRRWIPLSPESAICERQPESLAAAIRRVLLERRRVDPTPFVEGFSSGAAAQRMLALFEGVLNGSRVGSGR
jgi:glycosyltransferase involved in cell wall biosynthesis